MDALIVLLEVVAVLATGTAVVAFTLWMVAVDERHAVRERARARLWL